VARWKSGPPASGASPRPRGRRGARRAGGQERALCGLAHRNLGRGGACEIHAGGNRGLGQAARLAFFGKTGDLGGDDGAAGLCLGLGLGDGLGLGCGGGGGCGAGLGSGGFGGGLSCGLSCGFAFGGEAGDFGGDDGAAGLCLGFGLGDGLGLGCGGGLCGAAGGLGIRDSGCGGRCVGGLLGMGHGGHGGRDKKGCDEEAGQEIGHGHSYPRQWISFGPEPSPPGGRLSSMDAPAPPLRGQKGLAMRMGLVQGSGD
jgi:hypothetical protein